MPIVCFLIFFILHFSIAVSASSFFFTDYSIFTVSHNRKKCRNFFYVLLIFKCSVNVFAPQQSFEMMRCQHFSIKSSSIKSEKYLFQSKQVISMTMMKNKHIAWVDRDKCNVFCVIRFLLKVYIGPSDNYYPTSSLRHHNFLFARLF